MQKIYLDYAATTPTDPLVVKAMEPYFFEKFGNASSPHSVGQEAKKAIEGARQIVADFIGAKADEIVFTSGGTESNNHAVFGAVRALSAKGSHIITSRIEHHSVFDVIRHLEKEGCKATYAPVSKDGLVNPEDIQKAITEKTILISVMLANNEIGVIQPLADIGKIAKEKGVCFHIDAVHAAGHIPVNVNELNCDLLSLAAHKFYGPKGVGALYIRKGTKITPFLLGGGQERSRRASTNNVPAIVGMGKAVEICREKMVEEINEQTTLRDKIISGVLKNVPDSLLNGHPTKRLPNNTNFAFRSVNGESLLMSLDMVGIAASMGSACTSGALEPSHVLRAIGLSDEQALGALRVTIGRWTTEKNIEYFLENLPPIIERLRAVSGSLTP